MVNSLFPQQPFVCSTCVTTAWTMSLLALLVGENFMFAFDFRAVSAAMRSLVGLSAADRATATLVLTLLAGLVGVMAPLENAQARTEPTPFWEEADKPQLTGRASKSLAKSARKGRDSVRAENARTRNKARVSRSQSKESFNPTRGSLSGGGGISWVASSGCVNGTVKSALRDMAQTFGSVTVTSTCRSRSHNASVGGARKSHHLTGDAADFRVGGNPSRVMAALRSNSSIGGVKHYGGGLYHIDTGPRRTW
jgi:Peptidase M15